MGLRWYVPLALVVLLGAASAQAVTTKDLATLKPEDLVTILTGSGIQITNVKYTGNPAAGGSFTGGSADGIGVDAGVILSSGRIADASGPNNTEGQTGSMGTAGDSDLDKLITPLKTEDAAVLEFDAVTAGPIFSIQYVFASEEYKEFVNSQFNDVFAFFVDGQNIALVPNSTQAVTINTINHLKNTIYYKDNPAGSGKLGTQFDGLTTVLTAVAAVTPGTPHHIRLAIADASDDALDTAVFLAQGGISGTAISTLTVDPPEQTIDVSQTANFDVVFFGLEDGEPPIEFSATGLPDGATVSFTPATAPGRGTQAATMHITAGLQSLSGGYSVTVRAANENHEIFSSIRLNIDCAPPLILGTAINQPNSQTILSGGTATLTVTPNGSGPFAYQWYTGHSGSTLFPIAGATSATFTTSPLRNPSDFWVRVTNSCGTADSNTAIVTPQ